MGSIQFWNWQSIPEFELNIFELEVKFEFKFPTEKLNPQINLPFLQR